MRKRSAFLFILFFFLFLFPLWGGEEVQTLQQVHPGDPLPIRLYTDDRVQEVTVLLWEEEARQNLIVGGKAFRVLTERAPGTGGSVDNTVAALWIGILGIPSIIPPGSYWLEIRLGEGSHILPLTMLERQFMHEEIALNKEMSKLRTEEDNLKIAEMRELLERVSRFEPRSVYHLKPFRFPVSVFRRTSQFGDRRKYLYDDGGTDHAIHTGIDVAAPRGTPVEAAGSGRVVFAGSRILTGNTVVLEHLPGVYSLYYHLDRIEVKEGALVKEGERIGTSGATGLVTGPHLHWEVRVGGIPVNPDAFLRMGPLDKFFQLGETAVDSKEGR